MPSMRKFKPGNNPLQQALDYLTGTVRVDNLKNPNSAAYKVKQSVGQPSKFKPVVDKAVAPVQDKKPFRNFMTPNQKVYGIGVGP